MHPKVEDLTPYAISVATGFARRRGASDPDAYVSEALLALVEEGRKWDPERGMSLKSFVRQRIVWALLRFHKRERERLELFDPQVDTEELYVADRATDERWHEEQMAKLLVSMDEAGLTEEEREVLSWLYLFGYTQAEVAEELGMSVRSVQRIRNKAVRAIRSAVD